VERSFYAIGHGLLIPLFFVTIGLFSDYRALTGHWALMFLILLVAIVGKLIGCGLAAFGSGMDWVRSLRVACGMISRGEVGLIVTTMGATTGIFGQTEVAVMVTVVLLTTLLTPVALRATYQLASPQDIAEALEDSGTMPVSGANRLAAGSEPGDRAPDMTSFRVAVQPKSVPTFAAREIASRNR
jgi:Kef-type K+ transport system membrane component KefB